MGKMRTVRQPIVAQLPGLDRLDIDLFKIRLRAMQRAEAGTSSAVTVKGVGDVVFRRDEGVVTARVDGKPISLPDLRSRVMHIAGVGRSPSKQRKKG